MSAAAAAWAGVISGLMLAVLGALWRVATRLATLSQQVKNLTRRENTSQRRAAEHDKWHMRRLKNGQDHK